MNYALTHAALFDGRQDAVLQQDMTVLVEGDRITAVQPGTAPVPAGYQILDLTGKFLMPGMINIHAHLFGTGRPSSILGTGGLQQLVIRFVRTRLGHKLADFLVKGNITQTVNSGVTTVRSSGDFVYSDVRIRDRVKAGKLLGPRMMVPGPAVTCIGGHGGNTFGMSSDDPAQLVQYVKQNHEHQVDYIKICVTGGVMDATAKGSPGEVKMTAEQVRSVCDQAHALGYHVASHTESTPGIRLALENGVDTIEHGSYLDDELVELFRKRGAAFVYTLSPAIPLAKLPPSVTKLNEMCVYNSNVVMEGMIEGGKMALANGIPVGLGTDASCALVTPYNMWREVRYFAQYCQVSNAFALYTATLGNAKIIGLDQVTGSVEPGKSADLLVLDANPLEDLIALRQPAMVMVQGKLIAQPKIKRNAQIEAWLDSISG